MTSKRLELLVFTAILAVYGGLAFYRLADYPPFWYDDITVAQAPIELVTTGIFPRIYTVPWYVHQFLMSGFLKVFGLGVIQIKLASVFMGGVLILAAYLVAKKLFSVAVALIATSFLIVDPFFFQTSRWGRSDITAVALFMLSLYFFLRMREGKSSLLFAALSALALGGSIFSHENGLFLGVPVMFVLLVWTYGRSFLKQRQFWVFSSTLALVAVPYLVYVARDLSNFQSQIVFFISSAGKEMGGYVFYHQPLISLFSGEISERWRLYIENYSLILALYVMGVVGGLLKRDASSKLLVTVVIIIQLLFIFIKKNNFYLVWMTPLLCMLLASLFVDVFNRATEGSRGRLTATIRSNRFAVLAAAFLGFVFLFSLFFRLGVTTLHSDSYDAISSQLNAAIPAQAKVLGPGPFWLALHDRDFRPYGAAASYAVEKRNTGQDFTLAQATTAVMNDFKPDYVIYEENDLPTNVPIKAALKDFVASGKYVKVSTIAGGWHYGDIELWKVNHGAAR
ncbi:MAG: glycosyltransferase family 39 protein [Dehalococcoidales bacterium]|nr:glycosyltransferase family 39 protein [Dehalococcoidales bacterium]